MIEFEGRDDIERYICTGSSTGIWAFDSGGGPIRGLGACHADAGPGFTNKTKYKWYASASAYGPRSGTYTQIYNSGAVNYHQEGFQVKGQEELKGNNSLYSHVQEYLQYICGPDSPYRNIHKNDIDLIKDKEDNIRGFILGPSVFEEGCNHVAVFNFLIANRMVRDYAGYFSRYGSLRKTLGLSKFEAFLLMPYFSEREGGIWVKTNAVWDAAHIPLKESRWVPRNCYDKWGTQDSGKGREKILSIKLLKEGTPVTVNQWDFNSEVWMIPYQNGMKSISERIKESTTIPTRFSKIDKFSPEDIVSLAKEVTE